MEQGRDRFPPPVQSINQLNKNIMSTGNFNYENRCLFVSDEDFENDNYPQTEEREHEHSNRSYPSRRLIDQPDGCSILQAVMTGGYFEGACIDYLAFPYDGMTDEEIAEAVETETPLMESFLDNIRDGYGYKDLVTLARFSNGEVIYSEK